MTPAAPGGPRRAGDTRRRDLLVLLAAITVPHLTITLGGNALGPLMPLLKDDLGLTPFTVGVLGGARFVGLLVVSIPAAAAVTRIGLRRSIVLLQVGFACCMAAFSLAHEVGLAVAAMALGSVFFAASNPATTTAVVQRFPPAWWPRAMNVKQMGVPLGSLIAALALPVAATAVGWRPAILGVAAVTFIGAGISWALYRDGASTSLSRHAPRTGLWDLFRYPAILTTSAMQALLMSAQMCMVSYLVLFLVERGTPLIAAAAYLAGVQAIAVAARFLWGVVADQSEAGHRWVVLAAVVAVSAAGIAALAVLPSAAPGWMLGGVTFLLGLGIMSWAGMIELVRSEMVGAGATAPATGVGYTLGAIGGVTGPPLFGLVVEAGGFPAAWGALAVSLVAAILLSLMLRGALGWKGSAAAPEGAMAPPGPGVEGAAPEGRLE